MKFGNYSTFQAGLGIGAGLFGMRLLTAQTVGDVVFAGALTVCEFSIVLLWEKKARDLSIRIADWVANETKRRRARARTGAAKANLDDHDRLLREAATDLEDFEREIELDYLLSDAKPLTAIATGAIRGGYHAGISANAAAVSGATPEEDNDHEDDK